MAVSTRSRRRGPRTAKVITIVAGVVIAVVIIGLVTKNHEPGASDFDATGPTLAVSASAESSPPAESEAPAAVAPTFYPVVSVVDGDTLHVLVNGQNEKVRVIGIDAPETNECWGREATNAVTTLLSGASVQLLADPTQADQDQYGRLLRYVILPDGTDFGQGMVSDGNAYEYTYNVPYENQAAYQSAQASSAANGSGLWNAGTCQGQRAVPTPTPAPAAAAPADAPAETFNTESQSGSCDIKGNINSKGVKIYHVPGDRDYDKTNIDESKGERWFCSVAEAEAAGWRAPLN